MRARLSAYIGKLQAWPSVTVFKSVFQWLFANEIYVNLKTVESASHVASKADVRVTSTLADVMIGVENHASIPVSLFVLSDFQD